VKGSYAGAIGLPQFMPGSINRHAVDFDGDGHIDLQRSVPPTPSAAWRTTCSSMAGSAACPRTSRCSRRSTTADRAAAAGTRHPAQLHAAQFAERGAALDEPRARHDGPLALVELQNGDAAPSFVAGTQNFYAITRYNWSSYYAMAVITLAEAVKTARTGKIGGSPTKRFAHNPAPHETPAHDAARRQPATLDRLLHPGAGHDAAAHHREPEQKYDLAFVGYGRTPSTPRSS
jgi:hypothetical protein